MTATTTAKPVPHVEALIRAATAPDIQPVHFRGAAEPLPNGSGTKDRSPAPLSATPFVWKPPEKIPPRRWLLGTVLVKEYMSLIVAAGGVGKTSWSIAAGLSVATGKPLIGEHVFQKAGVWLFNLEDPHVEIERRITAAMLHHNVHPDEVDGRLFVNSGRDRPLVMARLDSRDGSMVVYPDKPRVVEEAKRLGIGCIVVDPFIASHELDENSNPHMSAAARAWTEVAAEVGCAVLLVHHMRKAGATGQAADIESSRGAKALSDAARVGLTLAPMSAEEAKTFSIEPNDRWRYVRLDDAKANLAPKGPEAVWLRLQSVSLGNETPEYPNGDRVQAIERWFPPAAFSGLSDDLVNCCLDAIAAGPSEGQRYGQSKRGGSSRYVGNLIAQTLGKSPTQSEAILKTWVENGLLIEEPYQNRETRKEALGLFVDDSKRPIRSRA